jgi:hypothetical protein
MSWPTPTDYQEAIQFPRLCFQDPDLRIGTIALNVLGLPRVASGNFASVYMISGGSAWAVRCFLRPAPDGERRYDAISRHLQTVSVPCLLPFYFVPNGIRALGRWYPIVKMQWTDGEPLGVWVQKILKNSQALRTLADALHKSVSQLQSNRVAHCDLQHGNILVRKTGQIQLVDYDGMFVPAFNGEQSPELGHANYQHPSRGPKDYDQFLDNFAALVIFISLKALAEQPTLWPKYGTGENLIFSCRDFRAPGQSSVFRDLRNASAEVRDLATRLTMLCKNWPLPRVSFDRLLTQTAPAASTVPAYPTTPGGTARKPALLKPSVDALPSWLVPVPPVHQSAGSPQRSSGIPVTGLTSGATWKSVACVLAAMLLLVTLFLFRSAKAPVVQFYGNQSSVLGGQSVTLHWLVTGATQARIEPGIGAVPRQGQETVFPEQSTRYVLTAEGPGGTVSSQFGVQVVGARKKKRKELPARAKSRLPTVASELIDRPPQAQAPARAEADGQARGASGRPPEHQAIPKTEERVGLTQLQGAPAIIGPTITAFEAVPSPVKQCSVAILRWTVKGASNVIIGPEVGSVDPSSGYRVVRPTRTTRYTLRADGPGGSVSQDVTLSVVHATRANCGQ